MAKKPSVKARKTLKEFTAEVPNIKTAFFGSHPVAQVLATFFIGGLKNKNMRFFNSKIEALAWLKE